MRKCTICQHLNNEEDVMEKIWKQSVPGTGRSRHQVSPVREFGKFKGPVAGSSDSGAGRGRISGCHIPRGPLVMSRDM